MVIVVDAHHGPLDRQIGQRLGLIDRDQLKPCLAAFGGDPVEQGLHPDQRFGRRQLLGHAAFDRTARAFGDPQRHAGLQRTEGLFDHRQIDRHKGVAVRIRFRRVQRGHLRAERLVVAAKAVARPSLQPLGGTQQDFTLDRQPGPRRTKQIARGDGQIGCRLGPQDQRLVPHRQVKVDAFRQEILDQEGLRRQGRGLQIGEHLQPVDATRGASRDGKLEHMPARAGILDQLARIFHPVRPRQDRGQRQAFDGGLFGVPGKRRDIDRLARAICAPVGGHEHIDRRRGLAPLDPAVGQVELRVGQRQEGNVGVALLDHHHGRGRPARAARQARVEDRIALIIGRRRAQHGVGAVQQFNRHARLGRSRPQRADHDMQPIHARQGGDPKIRHDEPLPARRHDIGVHARNRRFQRIDARRHPLQRVAQGQAGGDVLVDLLAHGGGAGPDLFAHSFGEGVFRIDLNRRSEIIVLDRPQQVAVGHAEQRQVQLFGVHRLDRQGDVGGVRQHIAPAREAHPGIAVADVLRDLD